jgi:hypothetical protein
VAPQFAILANTGFRYDYVTQVEASDWREARRIFKRKFAGDYRTEDFRVSRRASA